MTDFNSIRHNKVNNIHRWQIAPCLKMEKYVLTVFIILFLFLCSPIIGMNLEEQDEYLTSEQVTESKIKEIGGNALLTTPLDSLSTKKKLKKHEIYGKGTWDLRLSSPYINHFISQPNGESNISNTGFLGAAIGFDYYHQNTQYLSLILGTVIDYEIPVPMGVDYKYGEEIVKHEFCYSTFMGLTNNHRYRFFSLGYGLSYSHNTWGRRYNGGYTPEGIRDDIPPNRDYMDNTIGLLFTTYWLSKSNFSLGVIYRPSFIRLNTNPIFKYEHLLSIDFVWRIRLKTAAKQK